HRRRLVDRDRPSRRGGRAGGRRPHAQCRLRCAGQLRDFRSADGAGCHSYPCAGSRPPDCARADLTPESQHPPTLTRKDMTLFKTLQEKLDHWGNPVDMLRNSQMGAYVYPVPSEFSNWRDEQRSWRETVGLIDQSYHMTDLYVEGPDTIRLLSEVGVNSFKNYGKNKGKQLICCNHDGYVIGDMVLFGLEDDKVNIVGRPPVANWIEFIVATGDYDVTTTRDERTVNNPQPRKTYRFELQGPNAWDLLRVLNGGPL